MSPLEMARIPKFRFWWHTKMVFLHWFVWFSWKWPQYILEIAKTLHENCRFSLFVGTKFDTHPPPHTHTHTRTLNFLPWKTLHRITQNLSPMWMGATLATWYLRPCAHRQIGLVWIIQSYSRLTEPKFCWTRSQAVAATTTKTTTTTNISYHTHRKKQLKIPLYSRRHSWVQTQANMQN